MSDDSDDRVECKHCKRVFILLFLFSNVGYKRQNFFHVRIYTKVNSKRLQRNFCRKREGILISLQSYLKFVAFRKSLKLLNLRDWCVDEWNSVAKSFPTISERWSRSFIFIFANPRFSKFKRSIFQLFFSAFFFNFFFHLLKSQL